VLNTIIGEERVLRVRGWFCLCLCYLFAATSAYAGLDTRLRNHVETLADAGGHHSRAVFTAGNRWSVDYILRQMRRSTREVYADTFFVQRRGERQPAPLVNAVAILPGESDSLLVICAHLDATADREKGWKTGWQSAAAPGAVDNATGTAALLEVLALAVHAPHKLRYTVMFIACNAEERNLTYSNPRDHHLGSRHAAEMLRKKGRYVKGVIAMDMIGYNTEENWVGLFADSRSRWLAQELLELKDWLRSSLELPRSFSSCPRSDNDSFARQGFPAVLFMESCEPWRSSAHHRRNPSYHSSRDLPREINYQMLGKVTRLVAAYVVRKR
jgi:hypothetical protein